MEIPVVVPDCGTEDEPIWVSAWLVDPGTPVTAGERILELRIPGITFDVPAPIDGVLKRFTKGPGRPVTVGETVGWVEPLLKESKE